MRERLTQNKSLVLNSHPVHITHITGNARTTQPTSYIYLKLPLPYHTFFFNLVSMPARLLAYKAKWTGLFPNRSTPTPCSSQACSGCKLLNWGLPISGQCPIALTHCVWLGPQCAYVILFWRRLATNNPWSDTEANISSHEEHKLHQLRRELSRKRKAGYRRCEALSWGRRERE